MAAGLTNNPKTWAWGAGILGIILVICGFLNQGDDKNKKTSDYTWVSIAIGFIMVLAGFMTLVKMGKKAGGMGKAGAMGGMGGMAGMGGPEASISPEPSPEGGLPM